MKIICTNNDIERLEEYYENGDGFNNILYENVNDVKKILRNLKFINTIVYSVANCVTALDKEDKEHISYDVVHGVNHIFNLFNSIYKNNKKENKDIIYDELDLTKLYNVFLQYANIIRIYNNENNKMITETNYYEMYNNDYITKAFNFVYNINEYRELFQIFELEIKSRIDKLDDIDDKEQYYYDFIENFEEIKKFKKYVLDCQIAEMNRLLEIGRNGLKITNDED